MTDKTINTLDTELTTVGANDLIGVWDVAAAQYKKAKKSNIVGAALTGGGTIATGGYTLTVPATGTAALISSGTWSPAITLSGSSAGTQTVTGVYYSIGNFVWVWARIDMTARNATTGGLAIETLPFAAAGTKQFMFQIMWANAPVNLYNVIGYVDQTYRSSIFVHGLAAAGNIMQQRLDNTHIDADAILVVTGCYERA